MLESIIQRDYSIEREKLTSSCLPTNLMVNLIDQCSKLICM